MTIKDLKLELIKKLKKDEKYVDFANEYAYIVLEDIFVMSKEELVLNETKKTLAWQEQKAKEYIDRILDGEPIAYITKNKAFMHQVFEVDENVLIPRQDTENIVENAILVIKRLAMQKDSIKVLDMCTGSGCIAISIAKELKESDRSVYDKLSITAVDVSSKALEITKKNIANYSLETKVKVIESNLFEKVVDTFDLIISNPPYIPSKEIASLDETVKREPILALDGGEDGLDFYRKIAKDGMKHLNIDGYILFEIGYNQADDVKEILKECGYMAITVKKDLENNDRVVIAKMMEG